MAKKNVDLKKFLLEKGERVGLVAAAGVTVLLVGLGAYAGLTPDSPRVTSEDIRAKAATIESKLSTGPAIHPEGLDSSIVVDVDKKVVDARNFLYTTDLSIDEGREDKGWVNPRVVEPQEYQVDVIRAQVRNFIVSFQGDKPKIGVLVPKEKPKETPAEANARKLQEARGAWIKSRYPYASPQQIATWLQQMSGNMESSAPDKYKLEFVDAGENVKGGKFAQTVHPARMVIISASFPYKEQLNNYMRALGRKNSLRELIAEKDLLPRFDSGKVRRRVVTPDGTPLKGKAGEWAELDIEGNYVQLYQQSIGSQPEDPSLRPLIFPDTPLVMPLPRLARGEYRKVQLTSIDKALQALPRSGDSKVAVLSPLEMQLTGKVNIWKTTSNPDEKPVREDKREVDTSKDPVPPEHILVRFVDADPNLKPGTTYQYQVQMRLTNPNLTHPEKIAYQSLIDDQHKVLTSNWVPEDPARLKQTTVTVTRELFYYPTEMTDQEIKLKEKSDKGLISDKDVAYLQVHNWLETVRLVPDSPSTKVPLGDWAITNLPVRRGEFISRTENAMVPIWFPTREAWDFAVPVRTKPMSRQPPGIPVAFVTDDLLVDWEGGKIDYRFTTADGKPYKSGRDDAALEVLVMLPDGTLRAQNSRLDVADTERKARYDLWDKTQKDVAAKRLTGGDLIDFKDKK
jgi:hypothetical protein